VNHRWSATAKSIVLLAVAAATPSWDVTALALFLLVRHAERTWNPANRPAKSAPGHRHRRGLLGWIHAWRAELAAAAGITAARSVLAWEVGFGLPDLAMLAFVAAIIWGPLNPARAWLLSAARRRRWESGLAAVDPTLAPAVIAQGDSPAGEWARVRIAPGGTLSRLADQAEALASWHAVADVRVQPDPRHAGAATITALRADPLAPVIAWPPPTGPVSLWQPVPVGLGEDGTWVRVTLFEHNLLVGGEPGAGKSVAIHGIIAAAVLDPSTTLWLLDPKLVELAAWRPVAERFAGNDIFEATDTLRAVQAAMDRRYEELLERGLRKLEPGSPLHVVVVDELAHYLTWADKKPRDAFTDTLRDLISRGRAAGVIVICATQKPAADVIPSSIRDLFGYRWALRCTTPAASDTVLGTGWASQGVNAAAINPAQRGVGWLLHEAGQPVRLRAFRLDDQMIAWAAHTAARLRQHETGDA
jgi:hypothetical protein